MSAQSLILSPSSSSSSQAKGSPSSSPSPPLSPSRSSWTWDILLAVVSIYCAVSARHRVHLQGVLGLGLLQKGVGLFASELAFYSLCFNVVSAVKLCIRWWQTSTTSSAASSSSTPSVWKRLRLFFGRYGSMILGLSHFGVSLSHASQLRQQWNSRTLARRTMRDAGVRNTPALDSRSVVKEASVMLFPLNSNPSLGGGSLRITEGVTYASVDDVRLRLNVYALKNRAKNPFLKKVEKKAAAHGGSEDNKMNYHRTSFGSYDDNFKSGGGAPVILFIHGGGWVRGDRGSHALPWIYEMASSGWVVVSCSYRKAPAFRFPAALRDVKKAMQWTRNNIHLYDGNPNFVVAAGDSAGGHLALLLTLTPNDPSLQDSDVDTSVRACLDMYGIRDFADEHRHFDELYGPDYAVFLQRIVMGRRIGETNQHLLEALSPLHILRKRIADGADNVPPIMLIHGDLDAMVPVDDARVFYDSLTKLRAHSTNAKDVYLEFPQSHHGFNFLLSPRTLTMHDALRDFANHVYDSHLHENSKSEALPEGHKVSLSSSL